MKSRSIKWSLWRPIVGISLLAVIVFQPGCEMPTDEPSLRAEMLIGREPVSTIEVEGINSPVFLDADATSVGEHELVIGVSVGNEHRAYLVEAFGAPALRLPEEMSRLRRHVVNDVIDGKPVTVTHCDNSKCTRVFADNQLAKRLNIGVGGLEGNQMLLLVNGKRFSQSSKTIPLKAYDYEIVSWNEWKRRHPSTKIYVGTHRGL